MGFSDGTSGKESACQSRRHKRRGFNPWVRKISWSRKWQPTPVFLPESFCGQRSPIGYSPRGHKELDTAEHTRTQYYWLIKICDLRCWSRSIQQTMTCGSHLELCVNKVWLKHKHCHLFTATNNRQTWQYQDLFHITSKVCWLYLSEASIVHSEMLIWSYPSCVNNFPGIPWPWARSSCFHMALEGFGTQHSIVLYCLWLFGVTVAKLSSCCRVQSLRC